MTRDAVNLLRSLLATRRPQRGAARGGFTFVEVVAASAMLAVLLSTVAQLASQARRHARLVDHRDAALTITENALEQITARPWDEITDATIAAWPLPAEALRRWPKVRLTGAVVDERGPLPSKRITLRVALHPQSPAGASALTTWVFRAANAP